MKNPMTLEQLLTNTPDSVLLDIQEELLSTVVPATGPSHMFVRQVNRMIDKGELCINPTTYRKVYLPTLAKAVQKEMARRYVGLLKNQIRMLTIVHGDSCEQVALDLVKTNEQGKMEEAV